MPKHSKKKASESNSGIGRQLLVSHMTVALLAVVILVAALAAMDTVRRRVAHHMDQEIPALRASMELRSGLRRSIESLRGWVLLKDPAHQASRKAAWDRVIWPQFDVLKRTADGQVSAATAISLSDVERRLRRLEAMQWHIEESSRAPGNEAAQFLYEKVIREGEPRVSKMLKFLLRDALDNTRLTRPSDDHSAIAQHLLEYQAGHELSFIHLGDFIATGSRRSEMEFLYSAKIGAEHLEWLRENGAGFSGDGREALDLLIRETSAHAAAASKISDARKSGQWNVALHALRERAQPLEQSLQSDLEALVRWQEEVLNENVARLSAISTGATLVMPMLLAVLAIAAWTVSVSRTRRFTAPIIALADSADRLSQGLPHIKIAVPGQDELGQLTETFNEMAGDWLVGACAA